jgi:hypothetical protein
MFFLQISKIEDWNTQFRINKIAGYPLFLYIVVVFLPVSEIL